MSLVEKAFIICCDEMETDLKVPSRKRDHVFKRWIYFKVVKEVFPLVSLKEIGEHVNRDHTTVLHGLNGFDIDIKNHPVYMPLYIQCLTRCLSTLKKKRTAMFSKHERLLHENINLRFRLKIAEELLQKIPQTIKTKYA